VPGLQLPGVGCFDANRTPVTLARSTMLACGPPLGPAQARCGGARLQLHGEAAQAPAAAGVPWRPRARLRHHVPSPPLFYHTPPSARNIPTMWPFRSVAPSARRRCGRGEPNPGADVAGVSPSRCRCGRGEPRPGADFTWVSPVTVQMWQGRAPSRCGRGRPTPGADVGGVSPVPMQMWPLSV
jgi:hypothetical protein